MVIYFCFVYFNHNQLIINYLHNMNHKSWPFWYISHTLCKLSNIESIYHCISKHSENKFWCFTQFIYKLKFSANIYDWMKLHTLFENSYLTRNIPSCWESCSNFCGNIAISQLSDGHLIWSGFSLSCIDIPIHHISRACQNLQIKLPLIKHC